MIKKKSEKRTPLHLPYKWHLCELKESTVKWSHHCATCSLIALQSRSQFTLKPQQDGNYFYHPLLTMKEWFISGEATQPRNIWSKTSLDGCNLSLGNCCSLRAINVMLSEISLSEKSQNINVQCHKSDTPCSSIKPECLACFNKHRCTFSTFKSFASFWPSFPKAYVMYWQMSSSSAHKVLWNL